MCTYRPSPLSQDKVSRNIVDVLERASRFYELVAFHLHWKKDLI